MIITDSANNHILNTLKLPHISVEITEAGCAEYIYSLSESIKTEQVVVGGVIVYFDLKYSSIIDDTILDFVEEGLNKFFRITNANATNTCGCGISFSL